MRVRAPQCQGVTYGSGDPATAINAERAVTVGEDLFIGDPGCEEFCTETIGQVKPVLFGVLEASDAVIPTGTAADGFADDHPDVGYDIAGTPIGLCDDGSGNSACFEALGQKCVNSQCRQYPIVKAGTIPSFSGMNFWDGNEAQLIFTKLSDSEEQAFGAAISIDPLPLSPLPNEAGLRCDFNPVDYSSATPLEAEKRLEQMQPHGALALLPGNFYIVQARNMNGNYYHWGESIPIDAQERADNGRTIHICTGPNL